MDRDRRRALAPWLVAAASACAVVAGTPLAAVNWTVLGPASVYTVNAIVGAVVPFAGAFLLSRRPANPIGRVLLSASGVGLSFLGLSWADYTLTSRPGALPGGPWAALVAGVAWVPFLALITLLPLWFPDGRPPGRFWTAVERLVLGLLVAVALLCAVQPQVSDGRVDNPLPIGAPWAAAAVDVLIPATVAVAVLLCLPAAVLRYWRAGPDGRIRQRWFLLGSALVAASLLVPAPLPASDLLTGAALALVAITITASVLRHRLYGIDVAVNRTLVYGSLTVLLVTLYLGVVGLVGVLLPSGAAVAGAAAVALALAPLHTRLRSMVRRLLYGDRDDPYVALTRLATRLERNLDPEDVPGVALREVVAALRVPHAAVLVDGAEIAGIGTPGRAASDGRGEPPVALVHQGVDVGELRVTPRPGETLGARDRALLTDLARPLASVLHAAGLRRELQRSRDELVEALEQERGRLRRDLHDGVGPTLAALVLGLDACAHAARGPEPERAVPELVDGMKDEVRGLVAELRRVIDELRPPSLDELGLAGALDRHLATFRRAGGRPRLSLTCPEELPGLPAAVEVAAYRIVSEAVTNVVRHAAAGSCEVRLTVGRTAGSAPDPALVVEVSDDGSGLRGAAAGGSTGAGLTSMRERAMALGGVVELGRGSPAGTVVRAVLPVPAVRTVASHG